MNTQDKQRFVQEYVERQKAYLPTYMEQRSIDERHGTPSRLRQCEEFGFETPVLRPRVPGNAKAAQAQLVMQPERTKPPPGEAPSETRDKPRSKRKKSSNRVDTDDERAARLADRRERKRKKRAIVNPPQKYDQVFVPSPAPKKGRTKVKKPAALALLHGFSATNVTKNRLTLKPAPSVGVFNKGRASGKKKTTATRKHCKCPLTTTENAALKDSASGNDPFSESAFLNKSSTDHDDSADSSVSSISNQSAAQIKRARNHTRKDRGKCIDIPAARTTQASARTEAESEVWDIELQSKLPSSVCDISSEPETKDSAPVVVNLRRAEWAGSINVAEGHAECRSKARTLSLSATRSQSRGRSALAVSDHHDGLSILHAVDVSSIHPSHSASQVGRRAADTHPSDPHPVTSKYFSEAASIQECAADPLRTSRSKDGIDMIGSRSPGQDIEDAALNAKTVETVASPIQSLISVPQPMTQLQAWYDAAPLEFSSDIFPYDDCYARADVPCEPLGAYHGCLEASVVDTEQEDRSICAMEQHHSHWYRARRVMADLTADDVEGGLVEDFEGPYDRLAPECDSTGARGSVVGSCFFETQTEYDPGELYFPERWFDVAETGQDFSEYEEEVVDDSQGEESLSDQEEVPGFLEGRDLLRGIVERPWTSGLVQAEMDVASRLRDHWRPLRL